jgi:hypothetical protein
MSKKVELFMTTAVKTSDPSIFFIMLSLLTRVQQSLSGFNCSSSSKNDKKT